MKSAFFFVSKECIRHPYFFGVCHGEVLYLGCKKKKKKNIVLSILDTHICQEIIFTLKKMFFAALFLNKNWPKSIFFLTKLKTLNKYWSFGTLVFFAFIFLLYKNCQKGNNWLLQFLLSTKEKKKKSKQKMKIKIKIKKRAMEFMNTFFE